MSILLGVSLRELAAVVKLQCTQIPSSEAIVKLNTSAAMQSRARMYVSSTVYLKLTCPVGVEVCKTQD